MQVVVLAAGLGSRLGALTERLPKALIPVAGEPLLAHAVRFARRLGPVEIVVVGGFGFADVAAEVTRQGWRNGRNGQGGQDAQGAKVTLIENPSFRDGNLVSLLTAREYVQGDFLLMNVDHIYRPAVAARVALDVDEVTAFVDHDRRLGADDMKVARDEEGHVRAIAKTLATFDCGYVGMTRVPAVDQDRYWAAAQAVLGGEGRAVHVERILARLATSDRPPACRDISDIGWLEIDIEDERDTADATVRAAPAEWR